MPFKYSILPLTYLQTYHSTRVVKTWPGWDNILGKQPEKSAHWRALRSAAYYLKTSGYGCLVNEVIQGWMFLQGWRQILYIDGLGIETDLSGDSVTQVETSLLSFAIQQAVEQHRLWVGLVVSPQDQSLVDICRSLGFHATHQKIMAVQGNAASLPLSSSTLELRPINRVEGQQAFISFTQKDMNDGEPSEVRIQQRLIQRSLYRYGEQNWLVMQNGNIMGYLYLTQKDEVAHLYFAAGKDSWGNPVLLQAIAAALGNTKPTYIKMRLASRTHHERAVPILKEAGFEEHQTHSMHMFKQLNQATGK